MLPWQTFFNFLYLRRTFRHPANMTEMSVCGGDAAFRQITLTSCLTCQPAVCSSSTNYLSRGIGLYLIVVIALLHAAHTLLLLCLCASTQRQWRPEIPNYIKGIVSV